MELLYVRVLLAQHTVFNDYVSYTTFTRHP